MKTLFLVRHAKSDKNIENLSDIDRPLNKRGYNDADLLSKMLLEKKYKPDLFISSPAVRAISTALIFARNLNLPLNKIEFRKGIYEASLEEFIQIIGEVPDTYNNCWIFGHNPTITYVANVLSGSTIDMPTSSIVQIEFNTKHWSSISPEGGVIKHFDFPKNHLLP